MPVQDNYKAPPREMDEKYRLGWIQEAIQQGTAYIKNTRGALDTDRAIDIISGTSEDKIPDKRSRVTYNKLKRQVREMVASSGQLRPIEGFKSDNPELEKQSYVLNKLWRGWWDNTFVDRGIRAAKQWAAVSGTGWLSPLYTNDFWSPGRGDITLRAYGAGSVLPVQIPDDGDIQRAYAVTIQSEIGLAEAHNLYPLFQDKIAADRSNPGFIKKMTDRFFKSQSPALRLSERRQRAYPFPVCDIFYTYILDRTINKTGQTVPMGDPGTSWYYEVPSYGSDIFVGKDDRGRDVIRKADANDCMLYPLRRLIISFNNCIVYDGTSKFWHGKVPLVKFTIDDWPFEPLGFPMTKDGADLQAAIVKLMRYIEDNAITRMDPPLQYGDSIAKSTMESLDLRAPGQRIQNPDLALGSGKIEPILQPQYYDVPQWITMYLQSLKDDMDYLAAQRDMSALAKAAQIPSSDSIEKLFEMAGPITQDIVRSDERSIIDLARMWMPLCFQFYTGFRTMQILGSEGATIEQFDYKPGELTPSHAPGEDTGVISKYTHLERAKMHMNNFFFQITRGSAYQMTNMSRKLLYAQLTKIGLPIDWWTLAEVMEVPNFGNPPAGTTTVIERYIAQQFLTAELAKEVQGMIQTPATPEEALAMAQDFMKKIAGNGASGEGRPPSFSAPPRIVDKPNEFRSTIATS